MRPEGFAGDVGEVGEGGCEISVARCCGWMDLNLGWGGVGREGRVGRGVREEGDEELGLGKG